ncbi:hypothetical protein [Natrinema amylolyticum]|uniref:hypothetical protein n=1 Tax=Natrinema amylolyticum TaxID=2878679 RepID=UPI001CFBC1D8|nr:hypothetical protein [Natrinema amylolyticum]
MGLHLTAVLDEPRGWCAARAFLGGSLAFVALYAYFEFLRAGGSILLLVFATSAGLSGVAELLQTDRRRSAIVLRATAIGLLVALSRWRFVCCCRDSPRRQRVSDLRDRIRCFETMYLEVPTGF